MNMFSNRPYCTVGDVESEGDMTKFTVTFGRVRTCSFGDKIQSSPIKAGGGSWIVVYFPKGFTDPDYASMYITSNDCEMDEGDADNPDRITTQAFASIKVEMIPEPPTAGPGKKKGAGGGGDEDDDDEEDEDGSVASSAASESTKASGSRKSGATGSQRGSQRSGSRRSGSQAGSQAGAAGAGPVTVEPIIRELSQLYTNKESSWGFEKLFDIGKLYKFSEGYMICPGDPPNPEKLQDGYITISVEIFSAQGIHMEDPELEPELTHSGRQRVNWTVHNIKRLTEKIGPKKRLSSSEFDSDGNWYFDLYPNGFNCPEGEGWMSFYLHSTRRQVELGEVYKVWFRLGLRKINPLQEDVESNTFDPVFFPPSSSCVSVFTPKAKCFGKQRFINLSTIAKGRGGPDGAKEFTIGNFESGGSCTFVLDMLVTDDEVWQVQHMVHEREVFGVLQNKCSETDEEFKPDWMPGGGKVTCYHCGKTYSKEVTNYQARMEEYGYELGREYITGILMREEEHWLDGAIKKLNVADKVDQAVKAITSRVAKMRMKKAGQETQVDDDDEEEEEELDESKLAEMSDAERESARKKIEKERNLQRRFEERIKALRLEVEDAHFSKPVCSKCAEKRKMLQNCRAIWAGEPDKAGAAYFSDQNACVIPKIAREPMRNFRLGWRDVMEVHQNKLKVQEEAMTPINIKSDLVLHAADEWISMRLSKTDRVKPPSEKPGRNAMTLVRGNIYAEPLELARQCNGRVNSNGITPEEDEDAPRDTFCDVRWDVRAPPKAVYCNMTGRVYCDFCAKEEYKVPLPQFEADPSASEPVQVCFAVKDHLGKVPASRIQPVSKKEEEEIVPRSKGVEEEEEEEGDDDPFAILRTIPFCGNQIADAITPQE